MWDKILTDDDGPYIELMVGAYSDNQPDYSWLQPYETKSFEMHWYPFRDIGGVKKANFDAAVNLGNRRRQSEGRLWHDVGASIGTRGIKGRREGARRRENRHRSAKAVCENGIEIPAGTDEHDLRASLTADGKELVAYSPLRLKATPMPSPVAQPGRQKTSKPSKSFIWPASGSSSFMLPARSPNPIGRRRSRAIPAIRELTQRWEFAN